MFAGGAVIPDGFDFTAPEQEQHRASVISPCA